MAGKTTLASRKLTWLVWETGRTHLLSPEWRQGEAPFNACGSHVEPGARPTRVYWSVPVGALGNPCGNCERIALSNSEESK